ncbi:MAG: DUF1638 domain-containing protein, partial [Candidatus Adiutrix sp.]|jgi:hypothetical protein|nr:DUF1638 domain-containing protein [Candidatus Adiutrix sp.]
MAEKTILIGCGIFQEEIEHILREGRAGAVEAEWLEVGLHDDIERLEAVLTEAAERRRGQGRLAALFGAACLPEMKKTAAALGLPCLEARNCLAALAGEAELKELEKNRTLVASPGWVRKMWLGRAGTTLGWKADDFRANFGRYDLILVLDPGLNPLTDEEIISCFDLVQVPIETRPCGLEHLRAALDDLLRRMNRQ